jgi:glycosyltransferase involved in cell wall biosynthesis
LSKLPKITIITPSFNQASFLEETILSVIEQGYPSLEFILIDGKSTDHSLSIIEKYQKHFTWWVSEKDGGQSEAINKGLSKASGELVMWLNSDDRLLPGALLKAAEFANASPEIQLFHGRAILTGNGMKEKLVGIVSDDLPARYLAYIPFPQPASFFRKSLLEKIGLLNEHLHYGMDYEFLVRAILAGCKVRQVETIFSKYRLHPESKSGHDLEFSEEWASIFSKLLRSIGETETLSETMKKADLYREGLDVFSLKTAPDSALLRKALSYHLLMQAHARYNALDLKGTLLILESLKQSAPDFYSRHRLNRLYHKCQFLPASGIAFLRNFTRK